MLVYSTKFRVKPELDETVFLENIKEWNMNGDNPIENIENITYPFKAGGEDRNIEAVYLNDERIIAVRTHTVNKGGIWSSEIILDCCRNVLSVYVNRTVTEDTEDTEARAFWVAFIKQIAKKGLIEKSLGFDISDKALCDCGEELIRSIPELSDEYALPIVYLSSASQIKDYKLAPKLTGLAIVVSDSKDLLKEEYPEPIYVFFPHKNKKPIAFGAYPFHREIQYVIYDYLNSREYNKLETWVGVKNEIADKASRELLEKYKDAAADNDAVMEMCIDIEKKMNTAAAMRDDLSCENNRLIAENARMMQDIERLKIKAEESGIPLIMQGKEKDLYENEQREIIMEILKEYAAKSAEKGSRRADILSSVIDKNPVEGKPEQYRNIVKAGLNGYKAFETADILKMLRETGIEITAHTGHYKIALKGDNRYVCEAAATCSDSGRGGKNLVSEINKKMF